ncbi:unnamed protein product [Euphydryas editha]|uniref:Uncharacterized protein n=1 Tax=Euphydryas editha TaxID=104508 RepID=A0AAU9UDC5_EUPED|nr:unnamed protein product [Euphydryas editha]
MAFQALSELTMDFATAGNDGQTTETTAVGVLRTGVRADVLDEAGAAAEGLGAVLALVRHVARVRLAVLRQCAVASADIVALLRYYSL